MTRGMTTASTEQRFALSLRHPDYKGPGVMHKTMATFPSFRLAWENALNMFTDAGAIICGCHFTPAIGCEPPQAEFMIAVNGKVEEYLIQLEA